MTHVLAPEIFKAYDIRGIVGRTLTVDAMRAIGRGLGTMALDAACAGIAIGCDGRHSGPELKAALADGITSTGADAVDIGAVTTPMTYFAAHHLRTRCAAMVTGSHNPPEYNGLKMVIADATLSGDEIQRLRALAQSEPTQHGPGRLTSADIREAYIARIASDVRLARPLRIAVDAGNGIAGAYAPELYRRLGCEVEELYCDVDGSFPHHHPDPAKPANLADLIAHVVAQNLDLGLAFDGDGDRLGVVTRTGSNIYPDRQLMLYAADTLSRRPGATIIYDVKSSRNLRPWIERHGGVGEMWKTGHSLIKARLKETGAPLAGEMSGHVFFAERWYGFDDGLYCGARLLEILSRAEDPSAVLDALPDSLSTPELHIHCAEGEPHAVLERLAREATCPGAVDVIRIDGVRVEYADGFGLARASNTTPVIVLRFEADDGAALARIQDHLVAAIRRVKPDAELPS
jgi:phosphomannomutase/phosphoglucomutase